MSAEAQGGAALAADRGSDPVNRRTIQGRMGVRLVVTAPIAPEDPSAPAAAIGIATGSASGIAIHLDAQALVELVDFLAGFAGHSPQAQSAEPDSVACWVTPPGSDEWHWVQDFRLGAGLVRTLCNETIAVQAIDTTPATQPSDCSTCVSRLSARERGEHLRVVGGGAQG